jgi:hypothetical protein
MTMNILEGKDEFSGKTKHTKDHEISNTACEITINTMAFNRFEGCSSKIV